MRRPDCLWAGLIACAKMNLITLESKLHLV